MMNKNTGSIFIQTILNKRLSPAEGLLLLCKCLQWFHLLFQMFVLSLPIRYRHKTMHLRRTLFLFFFLVTCSFRQQFLYAQCVTPINTFPYTEDFEASNGNWTRSSSTHWEWGQIVSKPVITAAGGGTKCWVVGGLSGNSYASGSSNLQSPCFDISSLSNPEISFKIFWETERRYDGVVLQYSTDGGNNWSILGSINSNNNCQGVNWYNYDPVNFLSSAGWSGNVQSTSGSCVGGGGSGTWLTARHSLSVIAGSTGVIFRFVFAAGLTCNNFDGFALDDMRIGEAPVNSADFTYTCGSNNSVNFNNSYTACKTSVLWDFDDPGSGSNNSSTSDNPVHAFSSVGPHYVTLTTNFATGPSIAVTKKVVIIAPSITQTGFIKCNGDATGALTVNVNPPGTYNYSWDTNPVKTTATVSNLNAGTYTVTVSGTDLCSISTPYTIIEPSKLIVQTVIQDEKCSKADGNISATVSGGTAAYTYAWSNAGNTAAINNLSAGNYSLQVNDANGCVANTNNLVVKNITSNVTVSLGNDRAICPGQTIVLSPGNFASYKWQDNSAASTYNVTIPGTYSVTVADNNGCTGFGSVEITDECTEIFFPNAFTPNNDSRNEGFGPLGSSLASLKNYRLTVYGRWGEQVFTSTNPFERWNGTYKGKRPETQAFTWIATYTINDLLPITQKGTVLIIR